jgi:hypothetical protein
VDLSSDRLLMMILVAASPEQVKQNPTQNTRYNVGRMHKFNNKW